MSISIRPASLPQDHGDIADVLRDESPDWAATADELAHEDAERDPRYHHATFVAEELGAAESLMVGVGFVGHDTMAHQAGRFVVNLRVRQAWQGRGVGRALHDAILEHLAPLGPRELSSMVWQAHPRAARFLTDRGFTEVWLRIDSCLDTTNFDFSPYAGLEQFAATEVNHPSSLHDACFIAVKDGEYLGYSRMIEADQGFSTDMTGVLCGRKAVSEPDAR